MDKKVIAKVLKLSELDLHNSQERLYHELSTDYPNLQLLDLCRQQLERDKRFVARFRMLLTSQRGKSAKRSQKQNS